MRCSQIRLYVFLEQLNYFKYFAVRPKYQPRHATNFIIKGITDETNSNCIYCNENKHFFTFKMISCLVWT